MQQYYLVSKRSKNVKFHEQQLFSITGLITNYKSLGFMFVSCSTYNPSNTPEDYNAHFLILLKFIKDGSVRNVIVDQFGKIFSMEGL